MKILFLTLFDINSLDTSNIYTDLLSSFIMNGHYVYIISPTEKRYGKITNLIKGDNYQILKKKIGNIQKTNIIEKGISTLLIDGQYLRAAKKYYGDQIFDIVIYSTPPISFTRTIKYFKKKKKSITYLLLKDIFPQNAVDLRVLKKIGLTSLIYLFFRLKEIRLYKLSDFIGCMSEANVDYILKHNKYLLKNRVEINPNSINIRQITITSEKNEILNKYNIPSNSTTYIYGGNLGKPQGIDFLCKCIIETEKLNGNFNIIVGNGTEYNRILNVIKSKNIQKTILIPYLPKKDFDELLFISDVGLIFLDNRFTIPNYPSRLLSYLQASLPILIASDSNTDLKNHIVDWGIGLWSESGDINRFIENYVYMSSEKNRNEMKNKSFDILTKNFDVKFSYQTIINHLIERK